MERPSQESIGPDSGVPQLRLNGWR